MKVGSDSWCEADVPDPHWRLSDHSCQAPGPTSRVKVLTYNLYWWNLFGVRKSAGGKSGHLIHETSQTEPYDIMGFQECDDASWPMKDAGLADQFEVVTGGHALAIAYRTNAFELIEHGEDEVAEDREDQWYGKRDAQWARLRHRGTSKTVFFVNHHGPLPVNTGGLCGGAATAYNILKMIALNSHRHDAVIFVGDFNANEKCPTLQRLKEHFHTGFTGKSFGGIDNVFTSCGPDSVLEKRNLGAGGSDHDALSVVLRV